MRRRSRRCTALRREGFSADMIDGFWRPYLGRHLPRPGAGDLEPPLRLRLQDVRRGRSDAAGRRHAGSARTSWPRACRRARCAWAARSRPWTAAASRSPEASAWRPPRWSWPRTGRRRRGSPAPWRRRPAAPPPACTTRPERSPVDEPVLVLNGERSGPVNTLCVPSDVAPSYAPPGAALVSASILGIPPLDDEALDAAVREQLRRWFGAQVDAWRRLAVHRIPFALPVQTPAAFPTRPATGAAARGALRVRRPPRHRLAAGRPAVGAPRRRGRTRPRRAAVLRALRATPRGPHRGCVRPCRSRTLTHMTASTAAVTSA